MSGGKKEVAVLAVRDLLGDRAGSVGDHDAASGEGLGDGPAPCLLVA